MYYASLWKGFVVRVLNWAITLYEYPEFYFHLKEIYSPETKKKLFLKCLVLINKFLVKVHQRLKFMWITIVSIEESSVFICIKKHVVPRLSPLNSENQW